MNHKIIENFAFFFNFVKILKNSLKSKIFISAYFLN